ncbi:replication factor-A carboxy-terminal domain protein [Trifolium pratense]|uniref:Replication factor-A carboxy-terminal domain protein n=1 Tax=Trifolium pratense TaxID=57577 RepID=A0A2K3LI63_TRIPR|nr:replication factor-A carboxy-terminal domain protein [Trifolium pratense]
MTEPSVISVADDFLQTQRMTIEDLIEYTEDGFIKACSRCASRISVVGGQLYCDKCKMPRTAVPSDDGYIANYDPPLFNLGVGTPLDSIEVVDSNNNEETVVHDGVQTPTSKDVGKKPLDLDGVGGSATKEPVVSIEDVDLVNSIEAPTCKPAMKASGNLDEAHVTTPKQTKMACVMIENTK